MGRKLTQEEYISKCKEIYKDKYDYSETVYTGLNNTITAYCNEHEEYFTVNAGRHYRNQSCGCNYCVGTVFNTKSFIKKARLIHGDKYDYSKVNYIRNNSKVEIICPIHGSFFQVPSNHLNEYRPTGCRQCGIERYTEKSKNTKEDFIRKSREIHGDKFDYTNSVYTRNCDRIKIFCIKHQLEFETTPAHHYKNKSNNKGGGCPLCWKENLSDDKSTFIEKCKVLREYDFDQYTILGEYKNNKTKILMRHECGNEFYIRPDYFLYKDGGCTECKTKLSKGEFIIKYYLEKNNIKFEMQKIFEDCRNVMPLRFDFYLPDYNMCIEFDGKQHYEVDGFICPDEERLKYNQNNDAIKNDYCKNNNINLIRILYSDDCAYYVRKIIEELLEHNSVLIENNRANFRN